MTTTLPKLTHRDKLGHHRFYWAEIADGQYRTFSQRDHRATPQASAWTRPRPSARRTPKEQCHFEVTAIYTKRKRMGWTELHPRTQRAPRAENTWYTPMLAQKYPHCALPRNGFYAQPKLDGVRATGTGEALVSRKNVSMLSVPHIVAEVYKFLSKHPNILTLDGELYLHGKSLHEISGLARQKKSSYYTRQLEYHIFDCTTTDDDEPFRFRRGHLQGLEGFKYLRRVETQWCDDIEDADFLHAKWLRQGYEGSMYRDPEGVYENKRTRALLKRKDFQEKEFRIVDIFEGNGAWTGCAKSIHYIDERGETFESGVRGDQAYLRTVLRDKRRIIGRLGTVRYFNLTPDRGVPYLPVTVNLGRWDI